MAYSILDSCVGCENCKTVCPSQAVTGEKKQLHTIDGIACIECGACGRICPARAVEDSFGLVARKVPKKNWEKPFFNLDTCMSCGICLDSCPAGALSANMQRVGNRHVFPYLPDEAVCMGCGFCADDCPVAAIAMAPRSGQPLPQEA